MERPLGVLLVSDEPARLQHWKECLQESHCRLWVAGEPLPDELPLDLLITDRPLSAPQLDTVHPSVARGDLGVILVGTSGPADVILPADFSPRELRLAGRLLGEIIRLRRRQRDESRARQVLSHLALSDPLTGLANRRAWEQELERRLEQRGANAQALCLVLLDLDDFKPVNEQAGYLQGDRVLQQTAQALLNNVRQGDYLARLGGDEFALLLELQAESVERVVERIRASIVEQLAKLPSGPRTLSAGCAWTTTRVAPEELLAAADRYLREAKRAGKNRTLAGKVPASVQ